MERDKMVGDLRRLERMVVYLSRAEVGGERMLLAGRVYNPREEGEDILVDSDRCVIFSYDTGMTLGLETCFRGLRVKPGDKITRRLQTHERHIKGFMEERVYPFWPEEYLDFARRFKQEELGARI